MADTPIIRALSNGANQRGVRDHNERLILSVLQRTGQMAATDIARRTHLSAQTISVILRKLASDGLVMRGEPVKGKVGKPSIPVALNPDGALSIGVKLGRRGCDLLLTNLAGKVLFERRTTYDVAIPDRVFEFLRTSFAAAAHDIGLAQAKKLCGIGIAVPFEMWRWTETAGPEHRQYEAWKDIDIATELQNITTLPVFVINDATSACWAEHVYGRGKEYQDYAYFFVSSFIGGGIVINQNVYEGSQGNAGALGSLRVGNAAGGTQQLVDVASLHVLEQDLIKAGHNPLLLWEQPQDWSGFEELADRWITTAAGEIAQACLSACAVIDFETIVIDGSFPNGVRDRLVKLVRAHLLKEDSRGLILPKVESGRIGGEARAIGAACGPIYAQYFLSTRTRAIE